MFIYSVSVTYNTHVFASCWNCKVWFISNVKTKSCFSFTVWARTITVQISTLASVSKVSIWEIEFLIFNYVNGLGKKNLGHFESHHTGLKSVFIQIYLVGLDFLSGINGILPWLRIKPLCISSCGGKYNLYCTTLNPKKYSC